MDKQIVIDFENIIKKHKVLMFDKIWEKIDKDWKLIYNLNGLIVNNIYYANVKIIFWLDSKKEKITENVMTYLYTFSCDYKSITITTVEETFNQILEFLNTEKTHKELSDFIVDGTDKFNKELKDKNIDDFVQNINYLPQKNQPCLHMKFDFQLQTNKQTYDFSLKSFKEKWEATIGTNKESLLMTNVYKKLIDWIYDTNGNNI